MRYKGIWMTLMCIMFIVTSCDNDKLLELNQNPNASEEIDMTFLLPTGQLQVAGGRYENWRANLIYSSTLIQHNASLAGYWSGDKYLLNEGYSSSLWDRYYPDPIKTLTHIVDQTAGVAESENLNAMATIMRCFALHRLTDLYGAIPYSQAGRGLDGDQNWFPTYESQETVYGLLVDELRAARDQMSGAGGTVGDQDIMYGGDVTQWQKFANSLLLRVGMRMSNVNAGTAQSVVEEAANHSAGVFTSNADNARIVHEAGAQGINFNGNSEVFTVGNGGEYANARPSATFISWMQDNNDPRLMIISGGVGDPLDRSSWDTDPANQRGLPNGNDSETIVQVALDAGWIANAEDFSRDALFSFLNPLLYDLDDPYYFVSYAEVAFILAEAHLNGWNVPGDATTHFELGVAAAIDNWVNYDGSLTVDAGTTGAYIASLGFGAATQADQERMIGEQYWAATYFNHLESYANWRRTGFPVLTPVNYTGNVTGGVIPRRMQYNAGEVASNPNAATAVSAQGEDNFLTRIWWDVN